MIGLVLLALIAEGAGNAGKVNTGGTPLDTACDDEKGKHLGTYQCLGNTIDISPTWI